MTPLIVPPPVTYADISQWQTSFDITAYIDAGYKRVSMRATYGTNGVDPLFAARWEATSSITRQAYHFAYPGDGKGEADWLLQHVNAAGGFNPGDEVMLDLESLGVTPQQAAAIAPAFVADIHTVEPNVRVFIYGNEWFITAAGLTQANLPNVGYIDANYNPTHGTAAGWDHVCIWQTTSAAVVPGFPAPVDLNTVICPSNLAHLTIGADDVLNDADKAWISEQISNGVKAELTYLMGTRTQPAGGDPHAVTTLASLADALTLMYRGDATHPSIIDAVKGVQAVQSRVADITAGGGQIDPQLATDIQNLLAALQGGLSWTVTTVSRPAS